MNKAWLLVKKIWFGVFNFPFLYSLSDFNVLFWITSHHRKKAVQWFQYSVLMNLAPFLISFLISYCIDPSNIYCFVNNGSLPIIAFGILATNMVYLIENIPNGRETYISLKSSTMNFSIIIVFLAAILYIFQSNFLNHFTQRYLSISLYISLFILVMSIVFGKKMFLLQNKLISLFEENFKEQMDSLQIVPKNSDIKF